MDAGILAPRGHIVDLLRTDVRHLNAGGQSGPLNVDRSTGFADLLTTALGDVNQAQNKAADLNVQLLTDPDSVDIHDVTIAMAEATMSLSLTKAVVDRALRAYNELVNMR